MKQDDDRGSWAPAFAGELEGGNRPPDIEGPPPR